MSTILRLVVLSLLLSVPAVAQDKLENEADIKGSDQLNQVSAAAPGLSLVRILRSNTTFRFVADSTGKSDYLPIPGLQATFTATKPLTLLILGQCLVFDGPVGLFIDGKLIQEFFRGQEDYLDIISVNKVFIGTHTVELKFRFTTIPGGEALVLRPNLFVLGF